MVANSIAELSVDDARVNESVGDDVISVFAVVVRNGSAYAAAVERAGEESQAPSHCHQQRSTLSLRRDFFNCRPKYPINISIS